MYYDHCDIRIAFHFHLVDIVLTDIRSDRDSIITHKDSGHIILHWRGRKTEREKGWAKAPGRVDGHNL